MELELEGREVLVAEGILLSTSQVGTQKLMFEVGDLFERVKFFCVIDVYLRTVEEEIKAKRTVGSEVREDEIVRS